MYKSFLTAEAAKFRTKKFLPHLLSKLGAHSSVNTSSVNGIYKVVSTIFQLKWVVSTLNLGCKVRSTLVPSNINTILKSQVIPTSEIIEIRLG